MKPIFAALAAATLITATPSLVKAGPIMKMLEEKKAKQATATGSGTTDPASASTPAAATAPKNPAFETAKLKCKQLGNKEGSDKFNSCVMTLME